MCVCIYVYMMCVYKNMGMHTSQCMHGVSDNVNQFLPSFMWVSGIKLTMLDFSGKSSHQQNVSPLLLHILNLNCLHLLGFFFKFNL